MPRTVARGALVGVGLLVATGTGTPAALADDTPAPGVAPQVDPQVAAPAPAKVLNAAPARAVDKGTTLAGNFGLGKMGTIVVAPTGDVPADLDRSGATLTITGGGITATCTTDVAGVCSVAVTTGEIVTDGLSLQLPPGNYRVVQDQSSPGLQADAGDYWTMNLCQLTQMTFPGPPGMPPMVMPMPCSTGGSGVVPNTSLFRRHLNATVVGAGAPLPGAAFTLSGRDYPHTPAVRGDGIYRSAPATSGPDGVLTFDGWFPPGSWTLSPTAAPAGFDKGAPATVVIPATVPETTTVEAADLVLARTSVGGDTSGDPATGTEGTGTGTPVPDPHVPAPPVSAPPAPAPPLSSPEGAGTGSAAPAGGGTHSTSPDVAVAAPQIPVLVPDTPTTAPKPPIEVGIPAEPSDAAAGPQVASPRLAPASMSYVEVGAIGVGILLVAFVVIGVGVLRRRARSRG